jgi:hypothetical protein
MLLGVPLDYCNEYDLANAIASFEKFHHWHQDDGVLERTMIYASFTSLALVPRDIVFGNYANMGGTKESWTAPCYVLTANFVDILPPDEDQMPPNGNPHPLPGYLMNADNNFVMPQFPELGWNDIVDVHQPNVQDDDFFQPELDEFSLRWINRNLKRSQLTALLLMLLLILMILRLEKERLISKS